MTERDELAAVARFGYETGHLARQPRGGWQLAGIANPESVAEHSHRTAVLAWLIAGLEGANAERAAVLGLFHDVPETRTTDLHSVAKRHVDAQDPRGVAKEQVEGLPADLAARYEQVIAEVEDRATLEARCSKDADRLDCLLRAREYQAQTGNRQVQPFVDNMLAAMQTVTGLRLGEAARDAEPGEWWLGVASAYGLPAGR